MTYFHAVVWTDHQHAQVLQFDREHVEGHKVKAHLTQTRQHGSQVRAEHDFFSELCDALRGITEVVVTGSNTSLADFRHYVEKHRPAVLKQVVGWETVDHPTDGQLVAFARQYFDRYDRLAHTGNVN